MTPKERNDLRELAAKKHKGNLEAAACEFIGVEYDHKADKGKRVPNGNVGAVFNIVDELEKYAELDAEESKAAAASAGAGEGNGTAGNDGKNANE